MILPLNAERPLFTAVIDSRSRWLVGWSRRSTFEPKSIILASIHLTFSPPDKTLTSLKLSGTINDSDLYYLGILVGNSVYSYDIAVDATKQQAGRLAYLDLSDVVIEGGEISKGHLGYARKLKELKLPKSPTVVGALCPSCKELTNVEINGATELRKTFTNCTSLTSITIPDNVTIISGTFYGCTALSSVTLGKGVKSIGDYAFNGCTALTSIIVPDSVTIIDGGAFLYCI